MNVSNRGHRAVFTRVDLIAVAVVLLLSGCMFLPAVQNAREAARRAQCSNNLKQMALGMLEYEVAFGKLPTGGEGTNFNEEDVAASPGGVPFSQYDVNSFFMSILPYLDEGAVLQGLNYSDRHAYNDYLAAPQNATAALTKVATYLCPSNALASLSADPSGFGQTDYMPTVFTDIDPSGGWAIYGLRNKSARADGLLKMGGTPVAMVTDGLSKTIALVEDTGRSYESNKFGTYSLAPDPVYTGPAYVSSASQEFATFAPATDAGSPPELYQPQQWTGPSYNNGKGITIYDTGTPSKRRALSRWADPDSGSGVSGPPNQSNNVVGVYLTVQQQIIYYQQVINNNSQPFGGQNASASAKPADTVNVGGNLVVTAYVENATIGVQCPWTVHNCGPNDEPFSFHNGNGVQVAMGDGSARFLSGVTDPVVVRFMVTPYENINYIDTAAGR